VIERIGKVVHWMGFLVSFSLYCYWIYHSFYFVLNESIVRIDGKLTQQRLIDDEIFISVISISIMSLVISWVLSYIFSGNTNIFPFDKTYNDPFFTWFLLIPLVSLFWVAI